jgi:Ribophorin I
MQIEPRFPIFGGWKTVWHQGYSLPISSYVSVVANPKAPSASSSSSHLTVVAKNTKNERELQLKIDAMIPYKSSSGAGTSVRSNALTAASSAYPINDYTLKIILPEGATLLSVEAPFPHKLEESRRWTYLDSIYGRAVAVLKAEGKLVSAGINAGDVVVRYAYPSSAIWVKPGVLVAALLAVFLSVTMLSRVDLSLGSRATAVATGSHEKRE